MNQILTYKPEDGLKYDNTKGKIINSNPMVLATHDLWGHIPGSATRVFLIFGVPHPRYPEVSYEEVS